jgi:hypothetical protein
MLACGAMREQVFPEVHLDLAIEILDPRVSSQNRFNTAVGLGRTL